MTRDRVFAVSLTISTLFHLSMVTLFSIVLMFERRELPYVEFELVEEAPAAVETRPAATEASGERLQLRGPDELFDAGMPTGPGDEARFADGSLRLEAPALTPGGLPTIELPKIEFAELKRVRLRQELLPLREDTARYFAPKAHDPWARFGRGLGELSDALLGLRGRDDRMAVFEPALSPVSRPAPGYVAYIEWMSEPKDRIILATPPVQALWGRDPAELQAPISLIFTVNPDGRVVEVLNPVDDELITSVGIALSKYRFAPLLDSETASNQRGTFRITPEPAG